MYGRAGFCLLRQRILLSWAAGCRDHRYRVKAVKWTGPLARGWSSLSRSMPTGGVEHEVAWIYEPAGSPAASTAGVA
ncbi:hypothetical protein GCM10023080_074630 [Streptomyces pseudoechinosporeus]